MNKRVFTYKKSGVDIAAADKFVAFISKISAKKRGKKKLNNNIGNFGSISEIPKNIKNPKIVACTDGVGTKIEIANMIKKYDTVGIDLVVMSVNDLIVQGAKPIVKGIFKGCKLAGCELVGGETAEMPDTYESGKFDIAGFAVGIVEKKKILAKNKIQKGNIILAIPSSGLHSNGYSLVRNILKKKRIDLNKDNFLKQELIKPTKIYVNDVLKLINKNLINGCSNITGGGLKDNIKRIIPNKLCAEIDLQKINTLKIFRWLKKNNIQDEEMLKTFNCGVGFCLIIKQKNLDKVIKIFPKKYKPYVIGKISNGSKKIKLNNKIQWF